MLACFQAYVFVASCLHSKVYSGSFSSLMLSTRTLHMRIVDLWLNCAALAGTNRAREVLPSNDFDMHAVSWHFFKPVHLMSSLVGEPRLEYVCSADGYLREKSSDQATHGEPGSIKTRSFALFLSLLWVMQDLCHQL